MRLNRVIAILALCFNFACATTTLTKGPVGAASAPVKMTHSLALWGWWEVSAPIALDKICPGSDWVQVRRQYSLIDALVGLATLGIYTPVTISVSCRDRQALM